LGDSDEYRSSRSRPLREAAALAEIVSVHVLLQALDDLDGLVGQAELLVLGGIVGFVVAIGQESSPHQNRQTITMI
jgi:hypothetical protein